MIYTNNCLSSLSILAIFKQHIYKNCNGRQMNMNDKFRLRAIIFKYKKTFFGVTKIIHETVENRQQCGYALKIVIPGDSWQDTVAARNAYKYRTVHQNIMSLQNNQTVNNQTEHSRHQWYSTFEIWINHQVQNWTFIAVAPKKEKNIIIV